MFQSAQPSRVCTRALIGCAATQTPDRTTIRGVIALDATLLRATVRWLACEPTVAALDHGLEALDDHTLRELILLLADAGTRQGESMPAQTWHTRHRLSVLAQSLAEEIGLNGIDQRLQTTLALADAESPRGAQLDDLGRYRGSAIDDLVDAHVGLRLAITLAAPAQARPEHARVLFGIDATRWQSLEDRAADIAGAQLQHLQLPPAWTDVEECAAGADLGVLLPRLQVIAYWVGHPQLADDHFETGIVGLVEAALHVSAAVYVLAPDGAVLRSKGAALREFPISKGNTRSKVAVTLAAPAPARIARWDSTAVVDQQVMSALGCESLFLCPIVAAHEPRGVLLTGAPPHLDDSQASLVLSWYGATLGHFFTQRDRDADGRAQRAALLRADYQRLLRETVHEANNPLAIVHNYLHIVLGRVADDPSLREPLLTVMQEIDRTAAILQQLVAADAPGHAGAAHFAYLPDLVGDIGRLFEASAAARDVVLDVQVDGDVAVTVQDADIVRQILTNLLRNAAEALSTGGHLRMACRDNVFRNGRRQAVITVADNGPGIPMDYLQTLLEPKATRKGAGHAGVGLALAHRLAAQIDASLDCESGPTGTTFTLMVRHAV